MASLAEIRAKLKEQENRTGGNSGGGDNAIYPFWNIPENTTSVLRFLPDGDASNTYFWRERQMIRLDFNGVVGQPDSKKVTVNVKVGIFRFTFRNTKLHIFFIHNNNILI